MRTRTAAPSGHLAAANERWAAAAATTAARGEVKTAKQAGLVNLDGEVRAVPHSDEKQALQRDRHLVDVAEGPGPVLCPAMDEALRRDVQRPAVRQIRVSPGGPSPADLQHRHAVHRVEPLAGVQQ